MATTATVQTPAGTSRGDLFARLRTAQGLPPDRVVDARGLERIAMLLRHDMAGVERGRSTG